MRRMSLVLLIGLLVTGCIASVGGESGKKATSHSNWEYKQDVVCVPSYLPATQHQVKIESLLQQRGMEGWELVSVNPSATDTETCYLLIFKRETR